MEYVKLVEKARFNECKTQISAIQRGLLYMMKLFNSNLAKLCLLI